MDGDVHSETAAWKQLQGNSCKKSPVGIDGGLPQRFDPYTPSLLELLLNTPEFLPHVAT
jgi:hypothetical protein